MEEGISVTDMTNSPGIPPIKDPDFTADASAGERTLTLNLQGNADINVKALLDQFIGAVHEEARRLRVESVVVDLKRVEFMNSSCIKSLVWWVGCIQELEPANQYRITFLSNSANYWQRRSLHALAGLASDLVTIRN